MTASDYLGLFSDAGATYAPVFGALLVWMVGVTATRFIMRQFTRFPEEV